ncbi:hypothetical protein GP486_002560 [Trichoglossum hirsutum]|uniref:Uncharacterized protein n=1 Tax=Trichoglossum hirsutum TaxID=265104 RepID=A0A9P8LEJ0_9PEZI|nr:hypothetical protein GP486_002560 [Trichoglossum hirsutum]
MSEQATNRQYGISNAVSSELADAARQEILNHTPSHRVPKEPWDYYHHTNKTAELTKEFVMNGDKQVLATLAGIAAEKVAGQFHKAFPVVFINATPEISIPGGRTNYIWSFIALGPLTVEMGLPAISSNRIRLALESGQALHVVGWVDMWFTGEGGGTALVVDWRIY